MGSAESLSPVEDLVLVTIDTLRFDALGFAGNERVKTPALDRLAASGWVFDNAHAHTVLTLPSHANILTGHYPYTHGIRSNAGFVLGEELPTLATLLDAQGFATAAFVSAFPLDARFGLARGFDLYDDDLSRDSSTEFAIAERSGQEVIDRARRWWSENAGEKRFAWIHLFEPHAPYRAPEPWGSEYADEPYLGEVAAVDAMLAPWIDELRGQSKPVLIALTSDHGESLGEHGELTHGLFAYESTLKVPLVLWRPGLDPTRFQTPAQHVDLLPTFLAAAGVEAPADLPGRSLLAAESDAGGITTYFESLDPNLSRGWAPLRGNIVDGHKLISLPIPELYDLAADPAEATNLIDDQRRRASEQGRLLPSESSWPPERGEVSSPVAAALESLGYTASSAAPKEVYGPEDDPKNLIEVDRMVHRFYELFENGRTAEATEVAREVVRRQPQMAVAHYNLAQALLEQGRLEEAIGVMEGAAEAGVAHPPLLRQLALSLGEAGRFQQAIAILEPMLEENDPDTTKALGLVQLRAGQLAEAKQTFESVLRERPNDAEAHQHLSVVALSAGAWGPAERHARAALAANESLPRSWNNLGVALYNLGRPNEAIAAWQRAITLNPDDFDLLYNLALVAGETGNAPVARQALERFIARAPATTYGRELERARRLLRELGSSPS